MAVVGAGPVGLSLALHAARALPHASMTIFDARPVGIDPTRDPRTLALSLGSIQLLQRLKAWTPDVAQPIFEVHISQHANALGWQSDPCLRISAADQCVPQLGAVLNYGAIVAPLEAAWLAAVEREPQRLFNRFSTAVSSLQNVPPRSGRGVTLNIDAATEPERFDLAIVAEGGVFSEQARKSVQHDYRQTAWVGKVTIQGALPGVAFERFTRHGPAALLPLPPLPQSAAHMVRDSPSESRAALVWCVPTDDDPVRDLNDEQRVNLLNSIFHADTGRLASISPLKHFALGLNAERSLVDARIVRIGNAAQTLHPVAGQGLNLGLRDAFELVRSLARIEGPVGANNNDSALDLVLRRVEWRRAPDRWAMIAATDFLARSFTWQLPGLEAARAVALAGLQRAHPIKSFIARQMMFGRR